MKETEPTLEELQADYDRRNKIPLLKQAISRGVLDRKVYSIQILFITALSFIFLPVDFFVIPVLCYWIFQRFSPLGLSKGARLINENRWEDALAFFQAKEKWYLKYKWLDENRHWLFISATKFQLRQFALLNVAFILKRLDNQKEAGFYIATLNNEYPEPNLNTVMEKVLETV